MHKDVRKYLKDFSSPRVIFTQPNEFDPTELSNEEANPTPPPPHQPRQWRYATAINLDILAILTPNRHPISPEHDPVTSPR